MINHYLDKEYYNFWIDFESKPIGEIQTAMVKSINQLIKDRGLFKKTLTIFTNVRREIISKRKEEKSPASDVLGLLYGANLIGVDRDPPRPGTKTIPVKTQKEREEIFKHKAREFDGKSYYYYKTNDSAFLTKNQNVTNNAFRLGNELEKQKQYFLENKNIENYVVNKAMLREFAGGKILLDIRKGTGKQTALF